MDQVKFYLEAISHYVVMGLEMVGGLLDQFALGANSKWLGALVAVALLLVLSFMLITPCNITVKNHRSASKDIISII